MMLFLPYAGFVAQGGRNRSGTTDYYPWWPTSKIFVSFSWDLMLCWPRGLSSKGRNVSTNRCEDDSIKLEVKTDNWSLWTPHTSGSIGKEENNCADWSDCCWLPRGSWTATPQWIQGRAYIEYKRSLRAALSTASHCDYNQRKTTTSNPGKEYWWPRPFRNEDMGRLTRSRTTTSWGTH